MNKKMKIIDIYCLIANKEKFPKKIKYRNKIYTFDESDYSDTYSDYMTERGGYLRDDVSLDYNDLNDEVEILDEEDNTQYGDIKYIELYADGILDDTYNIEKHYLTANKKDKNIYIRKINQLIRNQKKIIDELNKLRKEEK